MGTIVVVLRYHYLSTIRPCVRPTLQKSAVTFKPLDGLAQKFQCPLNSLQVIFGQVARTLRPADFRQIYLLRGFWSRGVVLHLFEIGTTRQRKYWEENFDF